MNFDYREYLANKFSIANKRIYKGEKAEIDNLFKIGFGYDWREGYNINGFAFILGNDDKIISSDHLVFYNSTLRLKVKNPGADPDLVSPIEILSPNQFNNVYIESRATDPEISVIGSMEPRTGAIPFEMKPDNEIWDIDLSRLHPSARRVIFCASIYDSDIRGLNLSDANLFTRLYYPYQQGLETEYLFIPNEDYSTCGAIEIFSFEKYSKGWEVVVLGKGYHDIRDIMNKYAEEF